MRGSQASLEIWVANTLHSGFVEQKVFLGMKADTAGTGFRHEGKPVGRDSVDPASEPLAGEMPDAAVVVQIVVGSVARTHQEHLRRR